MTKCVYCNKEITFGSARCLDCDKIWREGFSVGRKDIKLRIKESLTHLLKLGDIIE